MTALLYQFPRHVLEGRDVPCRCSQDNPYVMYCNICDGGLSHCVTCGGAEGSMPTHCPGERMPQEVSDAVYGGLCDYDARLGWVQWSNTSPEAVEKARRS